MTTNPDQLASDYEQLTSTLELYPGIKLSRTEGNPPDHYEIEYHIKGFVRNPDGSVSISDLHRVQITLPFGYPLFPPTVKPLTHIFHPDIDPAAIRIADQWQANPNLTDLVLAIGEMICGNVYSREDPFNQEAADYYEQHHEELPLDVVQIADISDGDDQVDTLEEDAFASLGLDEELFDEEPPADEEQIELLRLQIDQNNIFAASKILAAIPASHGFSDRQEIEALIAGRLRDSDRLYKEIEQLENQGKLREAGEKIKELEKIAMDTPGLDNLRSRIQQSQNVAESLAIPDDEPPVVEEKEQTDPGKARPPKPAVKSGISSPASLPLKPILIGVILIGLLGGGGFVYFKDRRLLTAGQQQWSRIQQLAATHRFNEAGDLARQTKAELDGLLLLRSAGRELGKQIDALLNAEEFRQGLAGRIKYNGKYVPIPLVDKLKQVDKLTEQAEQKVKEGKIRQALPIYEQAGKLARKQGLTERLAAIHQTMANLRFEQALSTAKQAESEQEWENAASTYRRALELARSVASPEEAEEITRRLTAATFRHELDVSRQSFTGAQWQQTINSLEKARQLIDRNPAAVSTREREELDRLLESARLYRKLSLAKEAYQRQDWDQSIRLYQESLALIDEKGDILGPAITRSADKIRRTLLMMQIARDQSLASRAEANNDLRAAIDHYRAILATIRTGHLDNDPGLQQVSANIKQQLNSAQDRLTQQELASHLINNYKKIFKKYYPSFEASALESPKAVFTRKIGDRLLFTLSCVDTSQGSRSRLQLQYLYDPETNRWSLYTGQ